MKRWGALLLVLPGGVVIVAAGAFAALYNAAETGLPDLDRAAIRGNAVVNLIRVFGWNATPSVARAFMALLHNEGAYKPRADGTYPMGDVTVAHVNRYGAQVSGPSVGPGQVLWSNLIRLGFVGDPRDLAKVGNERKALYYAARMFREEVDAAHGDLREALRRYNGSGDAAEQYADRAVTFAAERWGGLA